MDQAQGDQHGHSGHQDRRRASKVDDLVGLAPSNNRTSNPLLLTPGLSYPCPFDLSGHLLIPMDEPAIRLVLNALGRSGRPGPASPTYQPSCLP